MLTLNETYQPRAIRYLEQLELDEWRIKVYGITYRQEYPPVALVTAARALARQLLPQPAVTADRYGVGVLTIHHARDANFVLLDWWADENALQHRLYYSPLDQPVALSDLGPSGLVACVWELRVLCFERQSWVETVLANPAGPDLTAYLARQLCEDV